MGTRKMEIDTWNQLFLWASVAFAILAAGATGGAIITGNIISKRDAAKIAQIQPRRLSPEDAAKMVAVARQLCPRIRKIPVTAANGNQEAQVYATAFVKIFRDAGCISDLALPIPGLRPDVQGIHVGVRTGSSISEQVPLIQQILSAGGIQHSVSPVTPEFFSNEPFVLIVGAKPT
jgi:hypothetical protein